MLNKEYMRKLNCWEFKKGGKGLGEKMLFSRSALLQQMCCLTAFMREQTQEGRAGHYRAPCAMERCRARLHKN